MSTYFNKTELENSGTNFMEETRLMLGFIAYGRIILAFTLTFSTQRHHIKSIFRPPEISIVNNWFLDHMLQ